MHESQFCIAVRRLFEGFSGRSGLCKRVNHHIFVEERKAKVLDDKFLSIEDIIVVKRLKPC